MSPKLREMTGSAPEKSVVVAAKKRPLVVIRAVLFAWGEWGHLAMPDSVSSTLLMFPTFGVEKQATIETCVIVPLDSGFYIYENVKMENHTMIFACHTVHSQLVADLTQIKTL